MLVRCLTFLLLLPAFSFGEQQYYGTRVSSLSITGTSTLTNVQTLPLKSNDIITEANVRACIQVLYDTGRYSYIEVDATPESGGTHLTFRVRPYYYFSTVRLEPENLLDRPVSGVLRIPIGEKFSQTIVDRLAADVAQPLEDEGYFEAKVVPEVHLDEVTRLATVALKAGVHDKAKVSTVKLSGGSETFTARELLDAFGLRTGSTYTSDRLEAGIRSIRDKFVKLGFLNTRVEVKKEYQAISNTVGLDLIVTPGQFALVQVRGYDIGDKQLKTLIPVFEEGTVDVDLVEEGRNNVRVFIQQEGYFEATVSSEIIPAPLDNAVQINYTVEQGERHRIVGVRIEGNRHFTEEEIKARMKVRGASFLDRGVFSPELLEQDVRSVEAMYRNAGFEGTKVEAHPEEAGHALNAVISITVLVSITEGLRLPIEIISFAGNDNTSNADLLERSGLREGQVYAPAEVESARSALTAMYYARGFPDVHVEPEINRIQTNNGVQITFRIAEGEQFTIGQILVAGNIRTQEKIIHRNSNLYPMTPYNTEAILDSQQRLYATGLFTRVDIVPIEQDLPGIHNVLIHVEEGKPIQLAPSVGYQQDAGPRATIELSHNNLFGLDRSISVRMRGSLRDRKAGDLLFQTTYREPKLFNHNLEGFASFFAERTRQKQFDSSTVDFSIQALKRFSTARNILFTASYQTVNLLDIRVNPHAGEFEDEVGVIQIARLRSSYVRDRRDDPINPSSGTFDTTTFEVASRLWKSEVNFTSFFHQSSFYRALHGAVLASAVRFRWAQPYGVTEKLPITERNFAGGSTTLRGFNQDEAGPEAGGNAMAIVNVEYRFPLRLLRLKDLASAFFYDTGNVFPKLSGLKTLGDYTHTVGTGLRYNTPVGPVRFDMGINLRPKVKPDGVREERVKFFFTLGHAF